MWSSWWLDVGCSCRHTLHYTLSGTFRCAYLALIAINWPIMEQRCSNSLALTFLSLQRFVWNKPTTPLSTFPLAPRCIFLCVCIGCWETLQQIAHLSALFLVVLLLQSNFEWMAWLAEVKQSVVIMIWKDQGQVTSMGKLSLKKSYEYLRSISRW